ncbi:formylglycine-generating enzyme family protein [Natronospirillum operosum]|uniref:Formylglycine-generating enzyme family protein n=1 Tax=Natronospirillum operosum TaxID=2759953 RepID=A0A4Z0WH97_9GAMM|nr:formylglycine-generating enzyme family protein [Natronospirillum operosum]TGG95061.1 formylglycine-generating enzyme family protein [Natronospirillum operosum]
MIEDWMVAIPQGEIHLRDDRKKTNWRSEIAPFLMSRYLITQKVYAEVMSLAPATFRGLKKPVESVSWFDAVQFCNRLSELSGLEKCYVIDTDKESVGLVAGADGYRLPTDAEWEYSCRANSKAVQYGEVDDIAWYEGNSGQTTHDVGLKQPNDFGLFDMLGNVWEWCWDLYDPEVYGPYRVFRGGGWSDGPRGCLASNRRRSHPTYAIDDLGFRVARSVSTST